MKKIAVLFIAVLFSLAGNSQFKGIIVEEVENEGNVPGKTYRIYVELENVGDQVYIIYGDSVHPMLISSSKPFFQAKDGGAFSKDIQRSEINKNDSLKYDSWLTIGASDNYDNRTGTINFDPSKFETSGGAIECNKDGGWFCYPTDTQAYCGADKRVLIMQLTTTGQIKGKFCIMGKTAKGEAFQQCDVTFTTGGKK